MEPTFVHSHYDPLLACLLLFTKIQQRPISATALTAGLPLVNNRLTPALFVRAAERANLSAQITKTSLTQLSALNLPAVLLLKDQQACVLLDISHINRAHIIQPETGTGVNYPTLAELNAIYTGYAILLRPNYEFAHQPESIDTDQATQHTPNRDEHWLWGTMRRAWPIYSEVLVASFLINLFGLVVPLFIMNVYDRVIPNNAITTLWVLTIGVTIALGFDVLMRILRTYFIDNAGKNIDVRVSANIFEQIMAIKMADRPSSIGAFANTVQSFEFFRDFMSSLTITILADLPFVLVYVVAIGFAGGSLILVPLVIIPLLLLISWLLQVPLQAMSQQQQRYATEKNATLIESLGGIETIKCVGAEGLMQRRFEQVISLAARLNISSRFFVNLGTAIAIFLQQFASIAIVVVGVYAVAERNLTTGALIACTILVSRAIAPIYQLSSLLTRYHQMRTALASLSKIMTLPIDRPRSLSPLHRAKLNGDIEFKNVSFNYPKQNVTSLKNISFCLKSGERVGIIGRIGSGKSTLAKLIMGLYQPTEGMLLLDNIDIQQFDLAELRRNIGYVPQEIMLFQGSVKDNINISAPYIETKAMLKVAKIAGVDNFVSQHPQGFDLPVGERGSFLSGGQRQTIAIARALLLDPPVLIFDEPSNSLDDANEKIFKDNLAANLGQKTFVLITHKASMLSLVNRLIIIDKGTLVADGPKEEILQQLKEGKIALPKH